MDLKNPSPLLLGLVTGVVGMVAAWLANALTGGDAGTSFYVLIGVALFAVGFWSAWSRRRRSRG